MVMRVSGGSASLACNINTTPLIDVLLVLLVTLIMSLPLMTHTVTLDLPAAQPGHVRHPAEAVSRKGDDS